MTYSVQNKGEIVAFTDSEGLHKIRQSASRWGYEVVKVEDAEGRLGYLITLRKVKRLVHFNLITEEPMKE